jgi:hypothetical protein
MSTVIAIAGLMALFLAFPLIKRERGPRECGEGGCWKMKLGVGCGSCPLDGGEGRGRSGPEAPR